MVQCRFSQQVWTLIYKVLNLKIVWMGSTLTTCFKVWLRQCPTRSLFLSLICWQLWLERNEVIFENDCSSIFLVLHRNLICLGKSLTLQHPSFPLHTPSVLKEGIPTGWFDRAAQLHGQLSGARGVIRINKHTVFKWTFNCGLGTNTRVELLGVWALLTLASRLHILDLQVFGNSRIIIDWLNKKGNLQVIKLEC
jgi:hypothetical protein